MKILKTEESENNNYYTKKFYLKDSVQVELVIELIKQFESDEIKMLVCHCNTFDEDGNPLYRRYTTADAIASISKGPSPYVSFSIDFGNMNTLTYKFSLITSVNSDVFLYVEDKRKLNSTI